jgi:glutamate carboxypeptidase
MADRPGPAGGTHRAEARAAAVGRLRQLVELESPSGDPVRLGRIRDVLADRLRELGGQVDVIPGPAGDHILARFRGRDGAAGHLLVVGHYDTVWEVGWLASHPFTVTDGWATGPGVLDMKGAIVALENALALAQADGGELAQDVRVLLVSDEELSSPHSRDAVMAAAGGAAGVIGIEPPHRDGALKNGRRGVARVRLEVAGQEAHAGVTPRGGISAADELVDQLLRLREALPSTADSGCNVGTIAGGTRANVVAGRASAELGLRFGSPDAERAAFATLHGLRPIRAGARVSTVVLASRPVWPADPQCRLVRHVLLQAGLLGEQLTARPAHGAGDTNFTGAAGLPTVDGLGTRGSGAHSPDEKTEIDSILRRADLLAALFLTPLPSGDAA